jgi:EmrB/QacA subfamily drug resistance transporter
MSSATAVDRRLGPDVWRIAIVIILGMVMSALDTTIVNVALISLARDLHTTLDNIQWVVTAYLLSLAAVIPVSGWAATKFGAKRVFIVSIVLFTVGSALCGAAPSVSMLIFFRVLQGVGGGMVAPVGMMILVRKAGPQNLARVMSAIGVPIILAPVVGPTIGGLLLDHAGWRWIFYVNLPIGVLATIAAIRLLPHDEPADAGPLDATGLALVGTGLVGLTYGLAGIGTTSFGSIKVWAPLFGGILLVTLFVLRSLRVDHPLLDMRLYRDKAFAAASLTTACLGAAMFGGLILMPLYYQTVRGQDAVHTGLLLGPQGIGSAIAVWIAGRAIDRFGAGVTALVGSVISIVSTIPLVVLGAHTSFTFISADMVFRGAGVGLSAMPAMTAAYRVLRPEQINHATPQLNVLQRVGGSIGTAILTVILQGRLNRAGASRAAQAAAFDTTFWWVLAVIAVATLPTFLLIHLERQALRTPPTSELAAQPLVGAA